MKETFEHDTNQQASKGYPEYDSPHNLDGQMDLYAYAALSSAHPAGHLYWRGVHKQAAYPCLVVLMTKNEIGGFRKV